MTSIQPETNSKSDMPTTNSIIRFIKKWFWIFPAVFFAWVSYIGLIYTAYGLNRAFGDDSSKSVTFIGAYFSFWVAKYSYRTVKETLDVNMSKIKANKTGKMQPHLFDEGYEFPDLMTKR